MLACRRRRLKQDRCLGTQRIDLCQAALQQQPLAFGPLHLLAGSVQLQLLLVREIAEFCKAVLLLQARRHCVICCCYGLLKCCDLRRISMQQGRHLIRH